MVERPMPHCVACREEVEGNISLLSKNCKNNVPNNFYYVMLKFQETFLITVTSIENPQFVIFLSQARPLHIFRYFIIG